MKEVVILHGCSGSGKTTWASALISSDDETKIISSDNFWTAERPFNIRLLQEAHNWCFRQFLRTASSVPPPTIIVDNTNCSALEACPYVRAAWAFGYSVEHHAFLPPSPHPHLLRSLSFCSSPNALDVLADKFAARSRHQVPAKTIKGQLIKLIGFLKVWPCDWSDPHFEDPFSMSWEE